MSNFMLFKLASVIGKEFPSIKRNKAISVCESDETVTVTGFGPNECEAFCRDVDSIVYRIFEGKIKALEWAVVEEYGYVQFSIIPETAHLA